MQKEPSKVISIIIKIIFWSFPIWWGVPGLYLVHSKAIPVLAHRLIAVDLLFILPTALFFWSKWFRNNYVGVFAGWAAEMFLFSSCTSGMLGWFYDYFFKHLINPWTALMP